MVSMTMTARGAGQVMLGRGAAHVLGAPPGVGRTSRGRPPSPFIGANYVWAMQLVVFGSALLQQWACG